MKIKTEKTRKFGERFFSLVFCWELLGGFFNFQKLWSAILFPVVNSATQNVYVSFVDEVYGKIKENYWKALSDEELTSLFILATEKLTGQPQALKEKIKKRF